MEWKIAHKEHRYKLLELKMKTKIYFKSWGNQNERIKKFYKEVNGIF